MGNHSCDTLGGAERNKQKKGRGKRRKQILGPTSTRTHRRVRRGINKLRRPRAGPEDFKRAPE